MMESGLQIELGAKVLFFLLKTHQDTLVSNHTMRDQLKNLRDKTRTRIVEHRDRMGVNSAALNFLKRELKDRSTRFGEEEQSQDTSSGSGGGSGGGGGGGTKRIKLG